MDNLKQTLFEKVGPLPVWTWALLALTLILGYMYWKKIGIFAPASAGAADVSQGVNADQSPYGSTDTSAGGGGGGLADSLSNPSTLSDPNRPGVSATGANQGYVTPVYSSGDTASVLSLAAPEASSSSPAPTYSPVYAAAPTASGGYVAGTSGLRTSLARVVNSFVAPTYTPYSPQAAALQEKRVSAGRGAIA